MTALDAQTKGKGEINGRHVLFAFVALFFLVLAANAAFIYFAVTSATGADVEEAYSRGLAYNDVLEARAKARALGWRATIEAVSSEPHRLDLTLSLTDKSDAAVTGCSVRGLLRHPTQGKLDRPVTLAADGPGRYRASLDLAVKGQWDIRLRADGCGEAPFFVEDRLWVK